MAYYTNYTVATGEIINTGFAEDGTEGTMAIDGASQYVGDRPYSRLGAYFDSSLPVAYTLAQHDAKMTPPSEWHTWSNTTMTYSDTRSLANAQAVAWQRMKAAADAEEFSTFTWDGDTWQSDPVSAQRIRSAAIRTLLPTVARTTGGWVTSTNTVRTLTNAQLQALVEAMGAHIEAVHAKRRAKRVDIDATTTQAGADAIAW